MTQKRVIKKRKSHGSAHANQDHYLRPELWANGTLSFYLNSPMHNYEKYRDFHERQVAEAQRNGEDMRRCKKCLADKDDDCFSSVTSTTRYKKVDGSVSVYVNTAKRNVCNSCLYKKYNSKYVKSTAIKVGNLEIY